MKPRHLISSIDLIMSLIFAALLYAIISAPIINRYAISDPINLNELITEELASRVNNLVAYIDNATFSSDIATLFVWSLIGAATYTVLTGMIKFTHILSKDYRVSRKYIHPRNFSQSKFWLSAVFYIVNPFFVCAVIFFWLYFTLTVFIPFSSVMLMLSLVDSTSTVEFFLFIGSSLLVIWLSIVGFFVILNALRALPGILNRS